MSYKNKNLSNPVFAKNLIKQVQFKESYFTFKENKKWELSPSGKIEKIWKQSQIKKFSIDELGIIESFDKDFADSNFFELKSFLNKNLLKDFSKTALEKISFFSVCLSNIWYENYYKKFESLKESILDMSKDLEVFFYPHYLNFLTKLRNCIIKNMTNLVIPSVISFTMLDHENQFGNTEQLANAKNRIKIAFSNVRIDSEKEYNKINNKINEAILLERNNVNSDNKIVPTIENQDVKGIFTKEFQLFQFQKACKLIKISPNTKYENAKLKYEKLYSEAEVRDFLRGNKKESNELFEAWKIYEKYRKENAN